MRNHVGAVAQSMLPRTDLQRLIGEFGSTAKYVTTTGAGKSRPAAGLHVGTAGSYAPWRIGNQATPAGHREHHFKHSAELRTRIFFADAADFPTALIPDSSSATDPDIAAMEKLAPSDSPRPGLIRRLSRRTIVLLSIVVALVIIGLAVGLGVGLGLNQGSGESGDENEDLSPTTSSTPLPNPPSGVQWQPEVNSTWQIVLLNPLSLAASADSVTPDVDVFDIDLFTNDQGTIDKLHELGKKVICYFSAGSYEDYRPDSSRFQQSDMGKELDGWPGERWLDLSSNNVREIMTERIALAASKKCDGIDPDNVDGYVSRPLAAEPTKWS